MRTFIFLWNPARWEWDNRQGDAARVASGEKVTQQWTSHSKNPVEGDRFFLLRTGDTGKGIVGAGMIASEVFQAEYADIQEDQPKIDDHYLLEFDSLLYDEPELARVDLLEAGFPATVQNGGQELKKCVEEIEDLWSQHLIAVGVGLPLEDREISFPLRFWEGAQTSRMVNRYERNEQAVRICKQAHGTDCSVCGFDFKTMYGVIGMGFCHVHHLKPLGEIKEGYEMNPVEDLRPVCPNCHAMLHKKTPAFSIEEMREKSAE